MTFEMLVNELADPTERVATAKLAQLSGMEPSEAASFLLVWNQMRGDRREQLLFSLIELAEDNVELNFDSVFLLGLSDSETGVRRAAIQGLWEYEGRDLIDRLIALVDSDPDDAVRADAALGLGRFVVAAEFDGLPARQADRIDETLRRIFNDPTEPAEVRGRALESLGSRSEEWVGDLIDEAISSGDRRLELSAIHAMGRSADAIWLPSVLTQLENDDAEMRFEAAVAAGAISDLEAVPQLLPLLDDEDAEVRIAAIGALGEIGGDEAKDALRELSANADDESREIIAEALAEIEFEDDPLGFSLQEQA